jgi:GTP:adenosylcobinamide-phosphate guanylyltransferase
MGTLGDVTAIVLAGDRANDPLSLAFHGVRKALVLLAGEPMLVHVLRTLQSMPQVRTIIVGANRVDEIRNDKTVGAYVRSQTGSLIEFAEGDRSPARSVAKILRTYGSNGPVLVTTADNVLMSHAAVGKVLGTLTTSTTADVTVAFAREQEIREQWPGVRRTYLRFAGEGYSGCNMFLLSGNKAVRAVDFWIGVEQDRKRPWRLVSKFGWLTLLRVVCGRLDLVKAMAVASSVMNVVVASIVLDDPLAAMDIDRIEHWRIAEAILQHI